MDARDQGEVRVCGERVHDLERSKAEGGGERQDSRPGPEAFDATEEGP